MRSKFLFETSFDGAEGKVLFDEPGDEPPAPQFSEEELSQAREESFAAGQEAARQETNLLVEQATASAEESIAKALETLSQDRAALERKLLQEATEASALMLQKLFPALARNSGLDEIEALISDCLTRVREEPRIVIRVAAEQLTDLSARVGGLAAQNAYEGKIVVIQDEKVLPGDVTVEWADGGAQRDSERLKTEIEAAIARTEFLIGDPDATRASSADTEAAPAAQQEPASEETPDG